MTTSQRPTVKYIYGYPNGIEVCGKTEGGREVRMFIYAEMITAFTKYLTPLNTHVGHAVWHSQNLNSPFPCWACEPAGVSDDPEDYPEFDTRADHAGDITEGEDL